jgi:hypothetical protein
MWEIVDSEFILDIYMGQIEQFASIYIYQM